MKHPRGNALFLILIAVALFAAVSYAVTQSGRGGRGADKERAVIDAATITQYGAALATAAQRMILTGTDAASLVFCSPANGLCQYTSTCETGTSCLFAPEGGGAVIQTLPATAYTGGIPAATLVQSDTAGTTFGVSGVGTAADDHLLIIAGLTQTVCEQINTGMGLASPPFESDGDATIYVSFSGEYAACLQDDDIFGNPYLYYHVLVAR